MSPRCERCDGPLVPVESGRPVGDELYRRHERREIYYTGGCMGPAEPWWCWSCERLADPEPRPAPSMTVEGYQQSVLIRMREIAPEAPLPVPAPYDDPPDHLLEDAGRWTNMQLPKIKDLAAILGDPVGGGPSRHRFALPLWPDFWLEHTSSEEQFFFGLQSMTDNAEYVVDRRFVRRSGEPMRSPDGLRPWSVLRLEAEAFFGWEPTRTPNSYYHIVPFELDGRPMKAYFVYELLVHVEASSDD